VAAWGDNLYNQCRVPAWLSNVVAIAGGGNHSLALRQDGRVVAWGRNTYAQTNVPAGLSNLVAIAAGENHSLALRANGTLAQWGTAIPSLPALNDVVAIAAGGDHNLALRASGEVVAWGFNDSGQTNVPYGLTLPGSGAIALAAGENHSLVLEGDGRARFPAVSRLAQDPARHLFTLALPTARGRRYVIEYKNQLADTNWTLLPLLLGDGAEHALSDTNATPAWRFYRLR
jgi:alpha-tubulin suppressor-like RCC1 family protein